MKLKYLDRDFDALGEIEIVKYKFYVPCGFREKEGQKFFYFDYHKRRVFFLCNYALLCGQYHLQPPIVVRLVFRIGIGIQDWFHLHTTEIEDLYAGLHSLGI